MEDTVTHLIDQEGQKKSFNYDYSFWSHDGFEVDEEGYNRPIGDKYADQKKVYTEIGSSILVNAWYLSFDAGRATTVAYLPMDRQVQARATRWLATELIKESFLSSAIKSSRRLRTIMMTPGPSRWRSACWKFTTKLSRIYYRNLKSKSWRYVNTKRWEYTLRGWLSIVWTAMTLYRKK